MYTADFETTTDPKDCRVWAWAVCEIYNYENVIYGNSIESFLKFVEENPETYYFHNLKFDGEFIISELFKNGFTHNEKRATKSKTFQTIISQMGQFYQLKICFQKKGKKKAIVSTFNDSLKKLPMSVERIAKSFNLPINKLEIDYKEFRSIGHELTNDEKAYIKNDVQIVAMALGQQFKESLDALTIGADALRFYKTQNDYFDSDFPTLSKKTDDWIRQSYRGGWTYANPKFQADENHQDRTVGAGIVLDVNSLYPSVMYDRWLPIGEPIYFRGKYEVDRQYPLFIQALTAYIKLKKNHLPTIQVKGSSFFVGSEYITDSDGYIELFLTSVDLKLLFEHYDVEVFSYNGGFKFKQARGIFCKYIDYWMQRKANSTGGKRELAKLMLNSLYGKFATNCDVTQKIPYVKIDGSLGYKLGKYTERKPVYTAMGCFITAWARDVTIRAAQKHYNRFLYADTDSLHLLGVDFPMDLCIHPSNLGAWSAENLFSKGKYLRAKTYAEMITHIGIADENGEMYMKRTDSFLDVKIAGMPKNVKEKITFENMKRGNSFGGKLLPKHVNGGIILEDKNFTIL